MVWNDILGWDLKLNATSTIYGLVQIISSGLARVLNGNQLLIRLALDVENGLMTHEYRKVDFPFDFIYLFIYYFLRKDFPFDWIVEIPRLSGSIIYMHMYNCIYEFPNTPLFFFSFSFLNFPTTHLY